MQLQAWVERLDESPSPHAEETRHERGWPMLSCTVCARLHLVIWVCVGCMNSCFCFVWHAEHLLTSSPPHRAVVTGFLPLRAPRAEARKKAGARAGRGWVSRAHTLAALARHARASVPRVALTSSTLARSIMTAQEIEYSEKYFDDEFEYR